MPPTAGTLAGSSESVRVAAVEQDDAERGELHKQLVAEAIIRRRLIPGKVSFS